MQTRPLSCAGVVLLGLCILAGASLARAQSPSCSCPPIEGVLFGIDGDGTVEKFDFESGSSSSVPVPGDDPSFFATGLAVDTPLDAFWVNGLGLDQIIEFNPVTGELIPGPFPLDSPGTFGLTDALAVVSPGKLAVLHKFTKHIHFIRTSTGESLASISTEHLALGALAGGDSRLFARLGFFNIAEIDVQTGDVIHSFPAPDLNDNGFPDLIEGLAFDGTRLYAASVSAPAPNVAALDPDTGALIGISPYIAPSGVLVGLGTFAAGGGEVCDPAATVTDGDEDGVPDACDNCPGAPNPGQENRDFDTFGDACDLCPDLLTLDQSDTDRDPNGFLAPDGVGDLCDICPDVPDPNQENSDGEGGGDACSNTEFLYEIVLGGASAAGGATASAFPPTCGTDLTTIQMTLRCGAQTIEQASFGLMIGLVDPNCVSFGGDPGCNATDCTAVPNPDPALGNTVDRALSSAVYPGSSAVLPTRSDTEYFKMVGSPLCSTGQTVPLAQLSFASGEPGALPPTTDQGLPAGFDGVVTDTGIVLPKEQVEIKTNENAQFVVTIRPAVNDSSGTRWEVLGRAPTLIHLATMGFRGCTGVQLSEMSFGGCFIPTATPGERECVSGAGAAGADLGPTVADARTIGPDSTDTMFVELTGNVDVGEANLALIPQPGTPFLMGVLTMTCSPGLQPGITYQGISTAVPGFQAVFIDAETGSAATSPSLVGFETAFEPPDDSDQDLISEEVDNCRYKANNDQRNTGRFVAAEEDNIGDVCFCGDTTGDGLITGADPLAQQQQLAGVPSDPDDADRSSVDQGVAFNVRDIVLNRRALAGASGGNLKQVCRPAVPFN